MAVFWGTNYSIVKHAFREIDPQAFNALRLSCASLIFLAVMIGVRLRASAASPARAVFYTPASVTRRDRWELAGLGLVGHCCYQYCFMAGLARTSVANSSLMIGATQCSSRSSRLSSGSSGSDACTGSARPYRCGASTSWWGRDSNSARTARSAMC